MKILFVTPVFRPYSAGIGRVAENEARVLSQAGFEIKILTPLYNKRWNLEEKINNYLVQRVKPLWQFGNAALIKDWPKDNFDLIHWHYPFIGGVRATLKLKKKTNKPLVVTYHMDLLQSGWRGVFFKIYSWITLPKILKAADKIIVSSLDYAQNSALAPFLSQYQKKVVEIPFGVEKTEKFLNKEDARRELRLYSTKTILFVGALDKAHYFKGLPILFKSLQLLKNQVDFKLVIIGKGESQGFYQNLANKEGLSNQVIFKGFVSDEDLLKYYQAADLLILPSSGRSEAYGMVLLEAQNQGLPVLVSDLPGVRKQVAPESGGIFPVGDFKKMSEVLKDFFAKDKINNGDIKRWILENRSIDLEIKKLSDLYKTLV